MIHRIIGKTADLYLIQGDNATQPDGLFRTASILGRVTTVDRKGKNVFFGLGPERFLFAFLSRRGRLFTVRNLTRMLLRPLKGKRFVTLGKPFLLK